MEEEEEKQAASAKTFKLSEGRKEGGAEAAQVQNVLHVLAVVPFPP